MADMDGYEVAALIHGRPANRDTPIIFITANPKSAAAVFKGYSVGAVDYIFKPVSADVLISKATVFVDLYQRSRALKRQAEELGRAHDALDLRVRERTEQLARANERLKAVIAQRRRADAERTDLLRREQEARREAERVNRMKDQFLATLSHELRTPLNAMLGWAHLLETGQLDPDRVQRAVKVIKNSAFAQKQLIEDILDVSRIVNGRMMLNMSSVDIRSIVDGALDTLRPAAEAKQITVMTDIADVPATCGDRDRLQQIVWNLLSNAIKFTPRQEAEPDVPWAELPRLDGISVLVVDDELNARQVATAILQQKGAEVAEAASAEEALALVAGGRVGVIVSDIAMPVTDGYEMMRQLRQGSGRFVPAVALTAKVTPEDVATALSAGYQRHLPKPVSAAALVRTVAELLPCRSPSEMPDRGLRPSTQPSYAAVRPPSGAEV